MARPSRVAAGDEQDEIAVALDSDVHLGERPGDVERGADLGPAIGLRRGAAESALGGDDRLEAARSASIRAASVPAGTPSRFAQDRQAANSVSRRLVIVDAEDELDHRRHRRARLGLEALLGEQLGIILGRVVGGEGEIIGLAERAIERDAAALAAVLRLDRAVARGAEPVGEPRIVRATG